MNMDIFVERFEGRERKWNLMTHHHNSVVIVITAV